MLRSELSGLAELEHELELTGFVTTEIGISLAINDEENEEETVDLPSETGTPMSQLGDLWPIGKHNILVGNAHEQFSRLQLLQKERAELVVNNGQCKSGNASSRPTSLRIY